MRSPTLPPACQTWARPAWSALLPFVFWLLSAPIPARAQDPTSDGCLNFAGNGWDVHLNRGYIRTYYFRSWSDRLWTGDNFSNRPNGGFVADGRWYHIACVVDAQAGTLYVDGRVRDRLPSNGSPGAPTHPMELILGGTRVDKTTAIESHFVGQLDDMWIWDAPLDAASVAGVMAGRPLPVVPVTADWLNRDGQEVFRVALDDGSLLFLDADAQPLSMLGNGTGRLTPGRNGIPEQVLRMFPDGDFIGRTDTADGGWIQRHRPDGSPEASFSAIPHQEGEIQVSRSGEIWTLDSASPDSPKWALCGRNGRRVPGVVQPSAE